MRAIVFIVGYVATRIKIRLSKNDHIVAYFRVVVHPYKDESHFFNVVCFDKLAETIKKHLTKGSLIYIEGDLRQRFYLDLEGKERETVEIIARKIKFIRLKEKESENEEMPKISEDVKKELSDVPF